MIFRLSLRFETTRGSKYTGTILLYILLHLDLSINNVMLPSMITEKAVVKDTNGRSIHYFESTTGFHTKPCDPWLLIRIKKIQWMVMAFLSVKFLNIRIRPLCNR